ncbi:MAG: glycosyltransferase family 39 protein, partial [Candidatus Hydrogenedentes bacterium]|nr:glycosyltransferase family 39 protein [Candidatus Hydrogenedentota bacterium]
WAGSVMLTIDAPLALFWVFAMYAFHRAISGDRGWWVVTGIALGLGMLTKYTMLVLVISFLAYLILFDRAWLRRPGPYAMLGIMLIAMIPVVYWNVAHDWVSVRHTASIGTHGEKSIGKTIGHAFEFFGGQLGVVSPILFGMFAWSMVVMARWMRRTGDATALRLRQRRDAGYLFLCAMVLFGFYTIVAFTRKTEPNWPVCAYLAATSAFAWAWNEKPHTPRMRKLFFAGAILGCAVGVFSRSTEWVYRASAYLAPANPAVGTVYLGPLDFRAAKEPTNRLFGGGELGRALSKYVNNGGSNAPFICSDNYQIAAWAAFYTNGRPRVYCANLGDRRYNQYDLWNGWESLASRDALFIIGDTPEVARPRIDEIVKLGAFERADGIEAVQVWRQKTVVKTFSIARLHRYTGYKWRPIGDQY